MALVPLHAVESTVSADGFLQLAVSPGALAADFELRSGAALNPAAVARYLAERYGLPPEFITSSHTDSESLPPEGTDWPGPWDVHPFGDAAQWSPDDAE